MHMSRKFVFVYHLTGSTYSKILFQAIYISRIYKNLERNWEDSICIRVNNFVKFVIFLNFTGKTPVRKKIEKEKILKLSKLEYYLEISIKCNTSYSYYNL